MPSLAIDERFSAVHTLTDGTRVRVRLLRPDDREALRAGFERLSPDSRYRRFLSPTPRLTDAMLHYLTHTDGWNHVAVGAERLAEDGRPLDGAGVARFIRLEDAPDTAEAAVAVVDELQHRGLGRLLLATLVEAARERGIRSFRCHVLAGNEEVKALLGDLGQHVTLVDVDGLIAYDVALPAPDEKMAGSPFYRLFRLATTGIMVVLRIVGLGPENVQAPTEPDKT